MDTRSTRQCDLCQKLVSRSNFARHFQRWHANEVDEMPGEQMDVNNHPQDDNDNDNNNNNENMQANNHNHPQDDNNDNNNNFINDDDSIHIEENNHPNKIKPRLTYGLDSTRNKTLSQRIVENTSVYRKVDTYMTSDTLIWREIERRVGLSQSDSNLILQAFSNGLDPTLIGPTNYIRDVVEERIYPSDEIYNTIIDSEPVSWGSVPSAVQLLFDDPDLAQNMVFEFDQNEGFLDHESNTDGWKELQDLFYPRFNNHLPIYCKLSVDELKFTSSGSVKNNNFFLTLANFKTEARRWVKSKILLSSCPSHLDVQKVISLFIPGLQDLEEGKVSVRYSGQEFPVVGTVFSLLGDMPGINEVMCLRGVRSRMPCRQCYIDSSLLSVCKFPIHIGDNVVPLPKERDFNVIQVKNPLSNHFFCFFFLFSLHSFLTHL